MNAALDGADLEFLEEACRSNRDQVNACGPSGLAAIHFAVFKRDFRLVEMLMRYGADGSLRDGRGDSCAHIACRIGDTDLLNDFAPSVNLDMQNLDGETMLDICTKATSERQVASSL
mgnify:FL=1